MTASPTFETACQEGRLYCVLLDSVHSNGTMPPALEERWQELRTRLETGNDYAAEAELMFDLLSALETSGAMKDSWIEHRWQNLKSRAGWRGKRT